MTPAVVLPGGFGPSQQEDRDMAAAAVGSADGQSGGQGPPESAEAAAASAADGGSNGATAGDGFGPASAAVDAHDVQQQQQGLSIMPDESESDILPFAIDSEATASHAVCYSQPVGAAGTSTAGVTAAGGGYSRVVPAAGYNQQQQQQLGQQGERCAGFGVSGVARRAGGLPAAAAAAERDVAVGAFVKLVQEAAAVPLQRTKQQQQCGAGGCVAEAALQQPLLVGDALQQVQLLAAQLQALVFSGSVG
jgi:hypothetical protein